MPLAANLPTSEIDLPSTFEKNIKDFLIHLGFQDVGGGDKIGGVQVDAYGGYGNSLLIIECKTKRELGKKKELHNVISEVRGEYQSSVKRGFRANVKYQKYENFNLVVAVKNIVVTNADREFANQSPRVYIWDDNFLDYYKDLVSKINQYAKFNMLGDMNVKPTDRRPLTVFASRTFVGKVAMYLFFINPTVLLEYSYVARRSLRDERYYQRMIKEGRLNKIADYVDNNNIIPNNIIIAFGEKIKKDVHFKPLDADFLNSTQKLDNFGVTFGILEFPRDYRSCWVIDGQHRLYAFARVKKPASMPILAFHDLEKEKQAKIFLDINKFQKPVPNDLLWDLNGVLIRSEPDGIISNVVKRLNSIEPLLNSIYIPSICFKKDPQLLKIGSVCTSLKNTGMGHPNTVNATKNPFHDTNIESMQNRLTKAISIYFSCVKEIMPDEWKKGKKGVLLSDGPFSVMIKLFERIVSHYMIKVKRGYPDEVFYKKYLLPVGEYFKQRITDAHDVKSFKMRCSSEGGKDNLLKELMLFIKKHTKDTSFAAEIEALSTQDFGRLEVKLRELIRLKYKTDNENDWLNGKIPPDVYGQIKKLAESDGITDCSEIYKKLNLGQCVKIILNKQDLFENVFITDSQNSFRRWKECEVALEHIKERRNAGTHNPDAVVKIDDDALSSTYLRKVNHCIDLLLDDDDETDDSEAEK